MAARPLRPLIRCQTLQRALRLGVLSALLSPGAVWAQSFSQPSTPVGIVPLTASPSATATSVSAANGVATVTGGVNSGSNIYHRFSAFDTTQDGLNRVYFNIGGLGVQNLVVGVTTGPAKISVPLVLSSSADLIFLSPYGIQVSSGAAFGVGASTGAFAPLPKVSLNTANRLDFNNNTSNQSYFEAVTVSVLTPSDYPDGSPDMPNGLSAGTSSIGSIVLDGQTNGPVTLQVDQALMVADLEYSANSNLSPVLVKGQVTLATASSGEIYGSFRLGEWVINAWTAATLTADSGSGSMAWMAPVEVTPGSQFVLQGGAIDVSSLVKLYGWNSTGSIAFASLVSASGSNTSSGGIDLYGPGRIAVTGGSLQIEGTPQIGVKANYPVGTNPYNFTTAPYGAATDAFNLLFDISDGAAATVDGAIVLGQGGVSKLGGGDLTFNSGANSYTGPTNVQGGYLQVNGSMPSTATCSNGGSSNLCLEDILETIGALQDDPLSDNEDGSVLDAGTVDTASEEEGGSFDIASGEGSISGEDLDVDVAVNDSFEVADADAGDDGAVAEADGADGAGDETASIDGVDVDAGDGGALASVSSVASEQASDGLSRSDGQSTRETVQSLAPELGGAMPPTPTPQQLQAEMQRQVQQIRSGVGGSPLANLIGPRADESAWIASTDLLAAGTLPPSFQRAAYQPAIVHIRFSEDRPAAAAGKPKLTDAFLDITLVPLEGVVEGRRVEISKKTFSEQLRQLYTSLSRQDSLDVTNAKAPARQLFNALIGPIAPLLEARGVTTLLIAADRGLQAVPFAALHDGSRYFGDRYAFSITPSLALTNLNAAGDPRGQTLLAAGASRFDGLAPLPLVPQELERVGGSVSKDLFLNRDFTPEVLLEKAGDPRYSRVHVATHAEFLPGGPAASYLYSGVGPIPLSTFTRLRQQRKGSPLDLISFSACRTALGDPSSELGFAGLAVQAGARSAAGTLWYVDDVATSAYFQQMYRYLGQGVPKAESLQLTRQAFLRGLVRLDGDRVLGPDGAVLLQNLTSVQQRRVRDGLQNPYFWGGVELVGAPW